MLAARRLGHSLVVLMDQLTTKLAIQPTGATLEPGQAGLRLKLAIQRMVQPATGVAGAHIVLEIQAGALIAEASRGLV